MKFMRLVLRNAMRNKRRAILTVLSISIAIVTICILATILFAFRAGAEVADEARLVVRNRVSLMFPLPLAYRQRLAAVPGVKSVAVANWFGGNYQEKKNFFAKFAVDAETYFPMYPEFGIPKDQYEAFLADRKGCVIGRKLADKFGFKVGGTIPIIGDAYPGTWEFNVHGIYAAQKKGVDESTMYFHWKYVDESLPTRKQGEVGIYLLQLDDASMAGQVVKAVDAEFENSPDQTLTETEKAFQMDFVQMWGNIGLLVQVIGGAVVFALLLVAGNTMAMAARERTTEIAILKTLGFKNGLLSGLVVVEGVLLALVGWAIGCGIAWLVCKGFESAMSMFFPSFPLKPQTIALALAVALVTGGISGLFPAIHAARTSIAGAMRKVA